MLAFSRRQRAFPHPPGPPASHMRISIGAAAGGGRAVHAVMTYMRSTYAKPNAQSKSKRKRAAKTRQTVGPRTVTSWHKTPRSSFENVATARASLAGRIVPVHPLPRLHKTISAKLSSHTRPTASQLSITTGSSLGAFERV